MAKVLKLIFLYLVGLMAAGCGSEDKDKDKDKDKPNNGTTSLPHPRWEAASSLTPTPTSG